MEDIGKGTKLLTYIQYTNIHHKFITELKISNFFLTNSKNKTPKLPIHPILHYRLYKNKNNFGVHAFMHKIHKISNKYHIIIAFST